MEEREIRTALNQHWAASASGDLNTEHEIYADDAVCDYPQSGERILGRRNLQALRSHHPGKPSGFKVKRMFGNGDLWITEYTITYQERLAYTVSIMEFRNGKVVHETQYSQIPSRRRPGGSNGFSRSRDGRVARPGHPPHTYCVWYVTSIEAFDWLDGRTPLTSPVSTGPVVAPTLRVGLPTPKAWRPWAAVWPGLRMAVRRRTPVRPPLNCTA